MVFCSIQQGFENPKSDWELKEMGVERSIVITLKSFKKISSFWKWIFCWQFSFHFSEMLCKERKEGGREGRKEGRKEGEEGGREEEGGEKQSFHFKKFLLKTTFWTVSSISQCSHLILAAWLISWFSGKLSCHLVPTWLFYRHEYAVLTKCEMAAEEVKYIILSDVLLQALHCLKDEETQWRTFPPFPIKKEREVHFFGRFSHGLKVLSQPVGRERMGMGAPPRFSVMPTQLPEAPEQRLRHDLWVLSRAWLSSTRVFEHPLVQELILTLYALSPHQSQEVVGPSIPF